MSIYDAIEDGTFETPISGDGYSVMVDSRGYWRANAWEGDKYLSCPMKGWPATEERKQLVIERLRREGFHTQMDALEEAWR